MRQVPGKLIIVRHTESEWNALGIWTGITDVHLTQKGHKEAALLGQALKDIRFDIAFHSEQVRTRETLEDILSASRQMQVPVKSTGAINERDYGDLTGKNKWEVQAEVGEDQFQRIRRGWNEPVPNGETLKDVYGRTIPFYTTVVMPLLKEGKNVLIVSHGNSIRTLMKYIESISDEAIEHTEMPFGQALIYSVDNDGRQVTKEIRTIDTVPPPA